MLRSLFSGISGLRSHQQMMDITGNNIANVNTAGFKSSQAVFQDTLSQMVKPAAAPQKSNGGTNPAQIGLGVQLGSITTNFTQGSAQVTGRITDLMINGDGFFVLRNGTEQLYTRAGAFSFDANGTLTNPGGMIVQGWPAVAGEVDTQAAPRDVTLPISTLLQPAETTEVTIDGNLPADTTSLDPFTQSLTTYDPQGNEVTLTTSWTQNSPTSWDVTVSDGTTTSAATTVTFDLDGTTPSVTELTFGNVTIDIEGVTSYAGKATIAATNQNGSSMGSLTGFTIGEDGMVVGTFSNGNKRNLAQIALANFNNPQGMERTGNSMYRTTVNSGLPQLRAPGQNSPGILLGGSLEMSNVDLGQEFTSLIIAQRGFQANSKVIQTSDDLLNDLINLKR